MLIIKKENSEVQIVITQKVWIAHSPTAEGEPAFVLWEYFRFISLLIATPHLHRSIHMRDAVSVHLLKKINTLTIGCKPFSVPLNVEDGSFFCVVCTL